MMNREMRGTWDIDRRPSMPGMILKVFRERVLSGQYAPGTRLPTIEEMADEYDVGRSSVREAMRALQMVGVVEIRQGDGIYLARDDVDLISMPITWGLLLTAQTRTDLVHVRRILEVEAAGLAAQGGSSDDIAAIRSAVNQLEEASTPEAAADADLDFHFAVARASGNRVLARLLEGVRSMLRPVFLEALADRQVKERACRYHQSILEAISSHKQEAAREAMQEHLSFVAATWLGTDRARGSAAKSK